MKIYTFIFLIIGLKVFAQTGIYYDAPMAAAPRIEGKYESWMALTIEGNERPIVTREIDAAYGFRNNLGVFMRYSNRKHNTFQDFATQYRLKNNVQNAYEFGLTAFTNDLSSIRFRLNTSLLFANTRRELEFLDIGGTGTIPIKSRVLNLFPHISLRHKLLYFSMGYRASHVKFYKAFVDLNFPQPETRLARTIDQIEPLWMHEFCFQSALSYKYIALGSNLRLMKDNALTELEQTTAYSMNVWLAFYIHQFFKKETTTHD